MPIHPLDTSAAVGVPTDVLVNASAALKALAADQSHRDAFLRSPVLNEVFGRPASRYIVAKDRAGLWPRLAVLSGKGYRTGVEYVGEEVTDPAEIESICQEYLALIDETDKNMADPVQLGFDLSNVGLLVSRELAVANTSRILTAAASRGMTVIISMERSGFVDRIIDVFDELAPHHPNLGLTVQAHLHRTASDLATVAKHGRKIRLVKGVYREDPDVALARGPELNERYADLASALLDRGAQLACGTHDADVLAMLDERGITRELVEIEMLHGQQPHLLRAYRERGLPCRVATVYGQNWWLHFLHRLAEYPRNVLIALADLADPDRIQFGSEY